MSKSAQTELEQLKVAIDFLAGLLEEGSLVDRYHRETREEIAAALRHLVHKVEGLPEGVPSQLVESTAVRAIVDASEAYIQSVQTERSSRLEKRMREAEMSARFRGFVLNEWEQIGPWEYQASSDTCEGFIYVNPDSTYDLLVKSEGFLLD